MDDISVLKAAVIALVPIGLSIGICFFILAGLSVQSIRGKDVGKKVRRISFIITVLFAAFVGIFAVIRCVLND